MTQYIDKDALVAEIEKRKNMFYDMSKGCEDASSAKAGFYAQAQTLEGILSFLNSLEVKEVDLENYNKVKKLLSLSFMHFLDITRPEDKMCLSNGECFDIEKAFDELDFAKLFRYMEKYSKTQKGE